MSAWWAMQWVHFVTRTGQPRLCGDRLNPFPTLSRRLSVQTAPTYQATPPYPTSRPGIKSSLPQSPNAKETNCCLSSPTPALCRCLCSARSPSLIIAAIGSADTRRTLALVGRLAAHLIQALAFACCPSEHQKANGRTRVKYLNTWLLKNVGVLITTYQLSHRPYYLKN